MKTKIKKYYNANDIGEFVSDTFDPCHLCIIGGDCRKCDCFESRSCGEIGFFDEAFFMPVTKLAAISKVSEW